ncbi:MULTISPECIES: glycosyltransferase family 4 protein [unclassified Paraburkholderia]|uniref:glycosyltransferase family 4 protein n=1 Tax=unclassified Paraburkholderia TaxID=2615204 RepID=UPI00162124BA|nr:MULTISPECIES: glycosyltransferase family 4 protein [unclassified Paraburkholderia]MBB5442463.1 glycosyltransferase involved in cell wall biosynthesis [Paraburkholderia sp. WSM4177]MBB5482729.1 glycosyltransferase involved in cell wall biosynthesis [Paraburkholderia sp. WSM4180]
MNQDVLEKDLLRPATRSALDELTSVPNIQPAPRRTAPRASKNVRIAIVHDWLVTYAGAEKVLEQIIACFPDADLFSLVDFLDDRSFLRGKPVTTSFIQKLPLARSKYRSYLPLMPLAIEQLDVSAYDVVISSSHAVAKGILTGPDQVHISYVHSPIRYAWDLQHQYLRQSKLTNGPKSALARLILHYMRNWDIRTSNSVDGFVANSAFIARRIKKVYQRDAQVIFPPVDVEAFTLCTEKEDFYLTASRMVPYKKIDLIVEAFARMPERKLVVIGDGPDMAKIRAKAGPNVEIMGYQPFEVLKDRMSRAKAFVFAAEEDFGISVVEAQACGTPVIAYGKGGALETVRDLSEPKPTGMFFDEQDTDSIISAVNRFDELGHRFLPENCRGNAEQFSAAHFRERFFSQVRAAVPALRTATLPAYTPYRPAVQGAANVPRILAVDQSGVLGGAELSLLEIVKALRSRIEVVLFDDGPFNTALAKTGVEVTVLDAGALKNVRKQGGSLPKGQALKGLISLVLATAKRARKVDVIYANTQRAMVIGAVAGKLARRPVVWHLRDIVSAEHFGGKQLAIIKWCARLGLTHVIANSAASAQAFAKLTRFDSKRIDVVFNGIAAEPFDALRTVPQAVLRERLNLPRDAFLVGSFSRLARWKGQHVLLEAMVLNPQMHAVLVGAALFGEDQYESELRAFVAAHKLGERVHFLGFQHDIPACMCAVDTVVHTSITPEPFGRVIVEGMLAQRPVVASRAGGVLEIIDDYENGVLCTPGDAHALADTLAELRSNGDLRDKLVENGYRTAQVRFGTRSYVDGVARILTGVAAR